MATSWREPRRGEEHGFSLIELLVVMAITGVIGAAVVAAVASAAGAERRALDMRENTDTARIAVERVRDTIRSSFGVCDGSSGSEVTVWLRDTNTNDRVDEDELVTFSIVGSELRRADGAGASRLLASNVGASSSFDYLDRTGALVADPVPAGTGLVCPGTDTVIGRGDIATIEVTLSGDGAPDGRTSATEITTQIALRNAATADGTINPNRPPTAIFTHSCSGLRCTFNASESFDEDGTIASYVWDFGDATPTGSGVTTDHFYLTYRSFPVTLTVIDNAGASASVTQFVSVEAGNATPSAAFSVSCVGLNCTFDASASFDADGTIESYAWDFADGQTGTGQTVSHLYGAPGTYAVTLEVTDNDGGLGTQTETANPTALATLIEITSIDNVSFRSGNSSNWTPAVRITARYPDGAAANAVRINGRFGPENSTDLKSAQTNAEGTVTLQANGKVNSATYLFSTLSVDGHTIANPSGASKVLNRPS